MNAHRAITILLVTAMAAAAGWAQEPAPKGAEGEKKKETTEPSTVDEHEIWDQLYKPDEGAVQSWDEFVADWMTPQPFPKKQVIRIDDEHAYPHIAASIKMKIVREDDEYVWLVGLPPENPESPLYKIWARREADQAVQIAQREAFAAPGAANFLDFAAEEVPPPFMESIHFERSAENLPTDGRWQMGFATADMNEDGHPDLIFPPRRKGYPVAPAIFLGDGDGGFRIWGEAKYPQDAPWDYGGVAAGDFDGDGHQDLAFAIHFKSQFVLYGDGKGRFPRADMLRSPDPRLTSRAVATADFDGDGRLDLAFTAEVDYDVTTEAKIEGATTTWVHLNRGGSWQLSTKGLPTNMIGDVIRAADYDGDGRPELVLSSNTLGKRFLVYSLADDGTWQAAEHRGVLSAAYHYDVVPVGGELFATFVQFRRWQDKTQARNGIVRYPQPSGGEEFTVGRPLVWDKERNDVFFRLAAGDADGDGRTDLAAARRGGGVEVFLQTPEGEFVREQGSELENVGRAFDIRLIDLDGDGRDDIVAGCVPQGDGRPGGVFVWLSKPAE
jgi:hypothetical protein